MSAIHLNPLSAIPQGRNESFHEDTRNELLSLIDIVNTNEVDVVCITGDIFNLKSSSRYSPWDILYYVDLFSKFECPVYTIPGNHDMPYSSKDYLSKSAYKLFTYACPAIEDLNGIQQFISKGSVEVAGYPYVPMDNWEEAVRGIIDQTGQWADSGGSVALLHLDAYPDGYDIPTFVQGVSYSELLRRMPSVDLLLLGHIHCEFEPFVYTNPDTGKIQMVSKPFAFGRVVKDYFKTEDDIKERQAPSYAMIEYDNGPKSIVYGQVEHRPFEECFKAESLSAKLDANKRIQSYFDSLVANGGTVDSYFSLEQPDNWLDKRRAEIPPEVQNIIDKYLRLDNV